MRIAFTFVLLLAAACRSECRSLQVEWEAMLGRAQVCAQDRECTTFESGEYCGGYPLLQVAVNKASVAEVAAWVKNFGDKCRTGGDAGDLPPPFSHGVDVAELEVPHCIDHACYADSRSCLTIQDAGAR